MTENTATSLVDDEDVQDMLLELSSIETNLRYCTTELAKLLHSRHANTAALLECEHVLFAAVNGLRKVTEAVRRPAPRDPGPYGPPLVHGTTAVPATSTR